MGNGKCPTTEKQLHPPLIELPHHKEVNFLPNPEMAVQIKVKRENSENNIGYKKHCVRTNNKYLFL